MEPDLTPPEEMNVDDALQTLMQDLPLPVREFLSSPRRDAVVSKLSQKYGLHADVAGKFERAFLYMLLGVFTPPEFIAELTNAGLPEVTVNGLVEDVNQEVFIPLRNAERTAATAEPTARPTPVVPAPSFTPQPAVFVPPPAPVAPVPTVPVVPAPTPAPTTPTYTPTPPQSPVIPAPTPYIAPSPVIEPQMRTMASDMAFAKEHRPSLPEFMGGAHTTPTPTHEVSAPAPLPIPQAPLPATPTPSSPSAQPFRAPPPNLPGAPEIRPVREYSVDPYREAVE